MEEWKEYKLGDLYEVHNGLSKGGNFFGSGYPFLSFSTVFKNFFLPPSLDSLVQTSEKERSNFDIKRGDVFITRTSETAEELGMSSVALKDYPDATYNGFTKRLRPINGENVVIPEYIGYYLRSPKFRSLFYGLSSSMSTRASLANGDLLNMKVYLPSLKEQKRMASILKSLDDKIENNKKINENLEQQAQALFKSWFVDFEPFRDQPFVESELGMIPEGWRVGTLGEIATISKKSINPANEPDKLYSHYSLPAFDDNQYPQKQFGKDIKSNKFLFNEDSILLSKLNPTIKRVWYVDKLDDNPICSTEFLPIETINNAFIAFVYCCIKDELYYSKLLSGVTGATNSHQRLSPNDIINLRIPINEKSIEDFNLIVLPMLAMINANIRDNLHLSHLRDTLLPKLMSGEIAL